MAFYKKRPVVVEAYRFMGYSSEILAFREWMSGKEFRAPVLHTREHRRLEIDTPEGLLSAAPGEWVVKSSEGVFYPCKPDVFEKTFEVCDNPQEGNGE